MINNSLRAALEQANNGHGGSLGSLTVLAPQNDPFRQDTPAGHRNGEWFAVHVEQLGLGGRTIHLRGLHYALLGRTKPDGTPYVNTDEDWLWLSAKSAKAARWLGYIGFEQIHDARNAPPVERILEFSEPEAYVSVGVEVEIPHPDELVPTVNVSGFEGLQPYKLVLVGEKTSLEPVLGPIAESYGADLYLPTGEISDTQIYRIARVGAEDGRRMVVLYFSDCDPAGWQMGISVARKLQALEILAFPGLEYELRRVALTPDQVREYGLPSTPLKDTERRADRWLAAMGVEQTEIDALATLQPDLLRQLVEEAIEPFFDKTLDLRVWQAQSDWLDDAQAALDEQLDEPRLDSLRAAAEAKLADLQLEIDAINQALQLEVDDDIGLPPIVVPEPVVSAEANGLPLIDSNWSLQEQTERLIAAKGYR